MSGGERERDGRTGSPVSEFERKAGEPPRGLAREFWEFIKTNKKWWLLPIILFLAVIGLFIVLTSTPVAPFIYTLF